MMRQAFVVWAVLWALAPRVPQFDADRERTRVLAAADRYLKESPLTISASRSPRSAGGVHDYFSEGDYWWPDPQNPSGPYIQKDGMSNPDNFNDHRRALMRFSVQMPALVAAYTLTKDAKYAAHAELQLTLLDDSVCAASERADAAISLRRRAAAATKPSNSG